MNFAVGPTQLHPQIPSIAQDFLTSSLASASHRSSAFQQLYANTVEELKTLMGIPQNYEIYFDASGSSLFERVILNLTTESSHHFVSGSFGEKWFSYAKLLGRRVEKTSIKSDFSGYELPEEIDTDSLICLTYNETSLGVKLTPKMLQKFRQKFPNHLIALDTVSAAPLIDFEWSDIDSTFFSVQKAFGMPAGLGVWVVSPNALKRGLALIDKYPLHQGAHNRISDFHKNYKTYQTPSTPNIMGIYMLCEICKTYNHLGGLSYLKKINEQQRAFFDKEISEINGLEFSITNSDYRSKTIAVLKYAEPKRLIEALKKRDITISKGYGDFEEQHIRIGIFPHHEMESIRHLIEALKSCLN